MILPASLLLCCPQLGAAPTLPVSRPPEGVASPKIDGVLDEDFWNSAAVITELTQVVPVQGATPSEKTEVLIGFDTKNLYLGLRCFDKNPAGIRATQMARDANLDPDDRVEFLIDTFNDNRTAFWFQLGAAGSEGDALISRNGTDFNKRWDTIWEGRSRITEDGWFGELRIPFASINFDPDNPTWGFNVRRFIRRETEEARWAGPEPRLRFFGPANAGELHGFEGLKQGLGLDLIPFYVSAFEHPEDTPNSLTGDAGLDVFYRVSPNTKLSLSFNTDFAETEVDARQVNLGRFPLFFPEKRKFFLEDSGVFNFGAGGRGGSDVIPFFSRRIGLDSSGNEVPLLFNAKVTSTTDSYSLGLLDSQTDAIEGTFARNLFVGRFAKNILDQSSVGVIYTSGNPNGATDDFTTGVDLNLQTNDFLDNRSLRFRSYVLGTEDSATSGDNLAYSGSVEYPNDEISASLGYTVIEDNFSPALGFVRRTGVRRYEGAFTYAPRLNTSIRRLRFGVAPRVVQLTNGETDNERVAITPLGVDWESGEQLTFRITPQRVQLFEDFAINDPVVIPIGDYDFLRYGASFETSDKRDVGGSVGFTGGSFYDGTREDYSTGLEWRLGARGFLGLDYSHNNVRLESGDFRVNLARLRADLHFSPRMSWKNFVQWDDNTENFSLNSRFRLIIEPGRNIYLVLNQGWTTLDSGFAPTATDLRFKISYTFRF